MPYMTSQEVANDLKIDVEVVYYLAGKMHGFFPQGKFYMNGSKTKTHARSMYTMRQHQLVGRTLERAPGDTLNDKLKAISEGFELSVEEQAMIYEPISVAETVKSFSDRLDQISHYIGNIVAPRKTKTLTELPLEFQGMLPEDCRKLARKKRDLNPDNIYHLARKTMEDRALDHCLKHFNDLPAGTKVHGNDIIDVASAFNTYFGKQISSKGKAWLRFRLRLIGSGKFAAPKSGAGYLVVAGKVESADDQIAETPNSVIA